MIQDMLLVACAQDFQLNHAPLTHPWDRSSSSWDGGEVAGRKWKWRWCWCGGSSPPPPRLLRCREGGGRKWWWRRAQYRLWGGRVLLEDTWKPIRDTQSALVIKHESSWAVEGDGFMTCHKFCDYFFELQTRRKNNQFHWCFIKYVLITSNITRQ